MENEAMGGSMYERKDLSGPSHSSLRDRIWAELAAFGPFAVHTDTKGIDAGGISTPVRRATGGETVIARFAIASGPGTGADAPECLATFKPDRPGPHHAAFLLTVLTNELTEFARTRQLSGLAQTIRSIGLMKGTPCSLNVDGVPVLGWALLADGASGIACEHRDRILMWLGTEQAVIPRSISTKIMTSTGWQEDNC
ncbi:hypothetical protein RKD54_000801 [Pseudarthrobacter sp. SLBN-100]|uniref:hypothetical protein n=1 Tax=Arthrobacter sp. SLBN-100 TaxID=2768450 RepID=UPI00114FB7C4|nr:hypothetical protein [Arthrobacter sp. SLBN-100]